MAPTVPEMIYEAQVNMASVAAEGASMGYKLAGLFWMTAFMPGLVEYASEMSGLASGKRLTQDGVSRKVLDIHTRQPYRAAA